MMMSSLIILPLCMMVSFGFDFSKHSIPPEEINSGGPGKDGIPSLTDPKFVHAKEAEFLKDSDRVIGIAIKGKAKAYPAKILSWHEAVNDHLRETDYLVTW